MFSAISTLSKAPPPAHPFFRFTCQRAPAEAGSIPKESRPAEDPAATPSGRERNPAESNWAWIETRGRKATPASKGGSSVSDLGNSVAGEAIRSADHSLYIGRRTGFFKRAWSDFSFSAPVTGVTAEDFIYMASRSRAFKRNIDRSRSFSLYISIRTEAFADVCWVACLFKKRSTYRSEFFRRQTPALERKPYVGHRNRSCKPLPLRHVAPRHATPPGRDRQRS
jgi:hypothetical protein